MEHSSTGQREPISRCDQFNAAVTSFSRRLQFKLLKDHSQRFACGNSGSRSGVIAWRNSLISLRQSSSVRSRGHSASSGSQQVIRGTFRRDFDIDDDIIARMIERER
jgi:hypothetical protein